MPTLKLDRAGDVQPPLGVQVRLTGLVGGVEYSDMYLLLIEHDRSPPLRAAASNTEITGSTVSSRPSKVLLVFGHGHIPEIDKPVVVFNPINVVDVKHRPSARYIEPRQSVSSPGCPEHANFAVPTLFEAPSDVAGFNFIARPYSASKNPRLWVVVKNFAQACCGKIGLSHDTVPSLIGQRPGRVISTSGLRYFITRTCSGAAEITKCLHQAAKAYVCMPAIHSRASKPFGALTPINAL